MTNAILRSVKGTTLAAAEYDRSITRGDGFDTLAALLASTGTFWTTGDIIGANGFRYEVVASGQDLTTAGAVKLKVLPNSAGQMVVRAFGTGYTALRAALVSAAAGGWATLIDAPISLTYTLWTDVVELPNNTYLIFGEAGWLTANTFGVPAIYHQGIGSVTLVNPKIKYAGTAATTRPAIMTAFNGGTAGAVNYSNRDQTAMIFLRGSQAKIIGLYQCIATDMSAPDKLAPRALTISTSPNVGEFANVTIEDCFFDGCLWGILAYGYDSLSINSIYSDRWSQLNTATYNWEAPGHVVYLSRDIGGAMVTSFGDCYDTGREVGTPFVDATCSFKLIGKGDNCRYGNLYSLRGSGALDYSGEYGKFASITWDGTVYSTAAKIAVGKAMRFGLEGSDLALSADIGTATFIFPTDYNDYLSITGNGITGKFNLIFTGTAAVGGMMNGTMNNCRFDINISIATLASNPIVATITSPGTGNHFEITTNSPQWTGMRIVNNTKNTGMQNSAHITDVFSGGTRDIGYGFDRTYVNKTISAPAVSGATVNLPVAIPKGATVMGVQSLITVALGTSNGTTGYTLGIAADPDMYGVRAAVTVASGTSDSFWTADGGGFMTANRDILITATGGNFNGTGEILVTVQYSIGVSSADIR